MNSRLRAVLIGIGLALGCAALGAGIALALKHAETGPAPVEGLLWPNPRPVGDFELVDHDGQPFQPDRLKGKWSFLFFGYTHCPDVCPVTLGVLKSVMQKLEEQPQTGKPRQVVFVSVDPARDTPDQLRDYVSYFGPGFVGVTGTEQSLAAFTRQLGIPYMQVPDSASSEGGYLVDHAASVLLVDPEGRLVSVFTAPQTVDETVTRYLAIADFLEKQS
jgi:cytochrome oxidase Cu insertion factor (SCO1/SenC/PrrC family)